jgi:putative transposase
MTWKKLSGVMRRLQFVKLASQAQRSMTQLCREFGYSRRVGYKWLGRFESDGLRGLQDRSKRPHSCPSQVSRKWVTQIRRLRRRHWSWGSRKVAASLRQQHRSGRIPSVRTISRWLKRVGLNRQVRRRTRRGPPLKRRPLTVARRSNQVWTVDFKGWFRTQDGRRVEPLTVRDLFSRYLLSIRLLPDQRWEPVRREFLRLFGRCGYPTAIRVDNGSPFGSTGPAGLSRLSAWWTGLGIRVEFIEPGHPEQNGGHEQMHRIYKAEATRPASRHLRAQQRRTDRWRKTYNQVRPHEALGQKAPAQIYHRGRSGLRQPKLRYPMGWPVRRVRSNGQIKWQGKKRFVGEAFVGYAVALRPPSAGRSEVYFANVLIGEIWEKDLSGMRPARQARRSGKG